MRVEVLSKTERPNLLSYLAMHQDYSEKATYDDYEKLSKLSEKELGERLVRRCVKHQHWGVIEHPSISFNVIGFPHSVISQARTHRVGISFDVQSGRYTSKRFLDLAEKLYQLDLLTESEDTIDNLKREEIEKIFYFRPVGKYNDRDGNKYFYSPEIRNQHLDEVSQAVKRYYRDITSYGLAPEHARDLCTYNFKQDFVVTFNARSLLHFLDLRIPKDAQLEIRLLAEMLFNHFKIWMPEVAEHYEKTRLGKNKLAP